MAKITQVAVTTVKVKKGNMGAGPQLEEERVELFTLDEKGEIRRCILPPNEKPGVWSKVPISSEASGGPAAVVELMRAGGRR